MKTGKALQLFHFLQESNTSKLDGSQQSIFISVYLELEKISEEFDKGTKLAIKNTGVEQDDKGNIKRSTPDQIASLDKFLETQNERGGKDVEIFGKLTREMVEIINANTPGSNGVSLVLLHELLPKQ